jgi:hypothetical protein
MNLSQSPSPATNAVLLVTDFILLHITGSFALSCCVVVTESSSPSISNEEQKTERSSRSAASDAAADAAADAAVIDDENADDGDSHTAPKSPAKSRPPHFINALSTFFQPLSRRMIWRDLAEDELVIVPRLHSLQASQCVAA